MESGLNEKGSEQRKTTEPLAKVLKTVAPAKAWVQKAAWSLDSDFCRNDIKILLQEAQLIRNSTAEFLIFTGQA